MFRSIKTVFFTAMTLFICNELNIKPLKCVSMDKNECKIRPVIVIIKIKYK